MKTFADLPVIRPMVTCIFCNHYHFDSGEPGYSEYTPGSPASLGCLKDHWDMGDCFNEAQFANAMMIAERCPDFECRKELEGVFISRTGKPLSS